MINLNIKDEDVPEFVGQIIDIFEDFLEEKEINIPNDDRESDDDAIIYGMDYGELSYYIRNVLDNWSCKKEKN